MLLMNSGKVERAVDFAQAWKDFVISDLSLALEYLVLEWVKTGRVDS